MNPLKDQQGVAFVLEFVLGALVLAVVGGAIYAARHHQAPPAAVATATPRPSSSPAATLDPATNWTKYVSLSGEFSLRYSPVWKAYTYGGEAARTCQLNRTDNVLDLDTLSSANTFITTCGGENPGQIHVKSLAGSNVTTPSYEGGTPGLYIKPTHTKVTVDQVEGDRYSAMASINLLGIEKDGVYIEYHFYAHGRNYWLEYVQNPSAPDVTADFDAMVTRTLKFSR